MKKLISVLITLALLLSCTAALAEDKPVVLTMIDRIPASVIVEGNPIFDRVEELTGIRIEMEAPPRNNYNERLQIVMSSGDLPDIIYTWNFDAIYQKYCRDGLYLNLDDYIQDYPNLMKNIKENVFELARAIVDGEKHLYAVPKMNVTNHWGMSINIQWLKKFGMDLPRTLDEFYEFGKHVAYDDPDGNGQDDTFLMSPVSSATDGVFAVSGGTIIESFIPTDAFGTPDPVDGQYRIREKMDGYFEALAFMHKLYEEKIMDPEFFVNSSNEDAVKMKQGRIATSRTNYTTVIDDVDWNNNDKFDKFTFIPPLEHYATGKSINYCGAPVWGGFSIPADADEETIRNVLRFLDWCNSPECFEVFALGVKGLTYNSYDLESRTVDRTPEQAELASTMTANGFTIAYTLYGEKAIISSFPNRVEEYNKIVDYYSANCADLDVPTIVVPGYAVFQEENPDLITKKVDMENKVIIGTVTMEEFKKFLEDEWYPKAAGYEQEYLEMMAEYNK